jgi:predicted extracellular nuclease
MKASLHLSRLITFVIGLALIISLLPTQRASAVSTNVVISQVYGGGGNSGATYTNDFVELFNRGTETVSLAGWSIQYTSATGTGNFGANSSQLTELSGSIASGQYLLIQEAQGSGGTTPLPTPDITDDSPINMAAGGGKVALVNTTTSLDCNGSSTPCYPTALATIVDLVGWGTANFYEGGGPAPATSNTTAIFRSNGGCTDSDNNNADFDPAAAPSPRNTASPLHNCTGPTNPSGTGLATPEVVSIGQNTLLTVEVTPGEDPTSTGLGVSCDLSTIGGLAAQTFYDDGSNGDVTPDDNTFSFEATPTAASTVSANELPCDITDAEARTGTTSISLGVIFPIGTVNGVVGNSDDGTAHRSPFAPASGTGSGQTVFIQGVIFEKTLQAIINSTNTYKGFFIQNTAATADGDPNTSDGLFVFMNTYSDLIGGYVPVVGDEVIISGRISEYYNMTELSSATMLELVRSGVDLNAELSPTVVNPSANLDDANRYWERLQGMRVQVPQGSIVLGGRNVFSPADAEVWVASPDSTIAQRVDPYTRRAFRDAHPLDDNYDPLTWDGNGYRILMGSLGIKFTEGDAQALIASARTFDTVTNSPAGGLNYTYSKYRIEISEQPTFNEGVDPAQNNPPTAFDRDSAYSIADYNLENLYDFRDNPFSGCDFTTDTGCSNVDTPFLAPINPPFNYVPASEEAYQARLNDIALQIINDLHSPDILMVQEVENQDICKVSEDTMVCSLTDNSDADGMPDVLQDLALKIDSLGGPDYASAFDPDSSDLRGILPAFMYRTDRVELVDPTGNPVLGDTPKIGDYTSVPYDSDVSNPKTLNAVYNGAGACETSWVFPRAPDIGLFRIYSDSIGLGSYRSVYVINNHFKSGPDSCVAHRTEQANYNAALVAYIQAANPYARIVVGGDLNVYPRPDDPFAPIGQPGSSDQLGALYDPSLGLKNLWEVLLGQAPEAAYSYVYVGMAQTLDQIFVNQTMLADLDQFRIAHVNSDFPADYPGDVARGTSDHDPNVATFGINFKGFFLPIVNLDATNSVKAGQAVPIKFSLDGFKGLDLFTVKFPESQEIDCETRQPIGNAEEIATAGLSLLAYDPTTDTYTLVWKTDKTWAGTCRILTVMLNDGTTQQAIFDFKK